jgi:hypothetical protein
MHPSHGDAMTEPIDFEAERERFEAVYPRPPRCEWIPQSARFCATTYHAWDAHKHIDRWDGWRARAVACGVLPSSNEQEKP